MPHGRQAGLLARRARARRGRNVSFHLRLDYDFGIVNLRWPDGTIPVPDLVAAWLRLTGCRSGLCPGPRQSR
jgi:hypothetical protein